VPEVNLSLRQTEACANIKKHMKLGVSK